MIRCRVDNRGLVAKLKQMANVSPEARRDAVIVMTDVVVRRVLATAPRDTQRYVRAWAEAGNAAGVGSYQLPRLLPAQRREQILSRLVQQVGYWNYIVKRYEAAGRVTDRWYRQAQRKLDAARRELKRFSDAPGGEVIAMNLFGDMAGHWRDGKYIQGQLVRALGKYYGGDGRIVQVNGKTVVVLHNREPHATLVERNTHVLGNAMSAFRGLLGRGGKRAYIMRMARTTGLGKHTTVTRVV